MKPTLFLVMDMMSDLADEGGFSKATHGVLVRERVALANAAAIACLGRYARIVARTGFDWVS